MVQCGAHFTHDAPLGSSAQRTVQQHACSSRFKKVAVPTENILAATLLNRCRAEPCGILALKADFSSYSRYTCFPSVWTEIMQCFPPLE